MHRQQTRKPLSWDATAIRRMCIPLLALALWLLPALVCAAGGGKPATKLYNVADTRAMESGVSKWIADVYNSNLWLYGITVVVIMAAMGLAFGFGMDRLLVFLGINLGKLEHHE